MSKHRRGRAAAQAEDEDPLEASARLIARATSITVFTGAGISVESGIPDFRSEGGLWQRFDPSVYCDYEVFRDRPEMFWTMVTSLYGDVHARLGGTREELRRGELRKPKPNAGEHEREGEGKGCVLARIPLTLSLRNSPILSQVTGRWQSWRPG